MRLKWATVSVQLHFFSRSHLVVFCLKWNCRLHNRHNGDDVPLSCASTQIHVIVTHIVINIGLCHCMHIETRCTVKAGNETKLIFFLSFLFSCCFSSLHFISHFDADAISFSVCKISFSFWGIRWWCFFFCFLFICLLCARANNRRVEKYSFESFPRETFFSSRCNFVKTVASLMRYEKQILRSVCASNSFQWQTDDDDGRVCSEAYPLGRRNNLSITI